ncbi:hypothetical protein ACFL3G_08550 [Planctomycetota bacterium]
MKDEIKKNLIDVLQAAEEIENFISGIKFETYQITPVVKRAVERDFEKRGEKIIYRD